MYHLVIVSGFLNAATGVYILLILLVHGTDCASKAVLVIGSLNDAAMNKINTFHWKFRNVDFPLNFT